MPITTAQKLKIKSGDTLLTLHAPAIFKKQLEPLPPAVQFTVSGKTYAQVHWFATNKAQVDKEADTVVALLKAQVVCWAYFPKGRSSIQTDLTRDKGWDALYAYKDKLSWLNLVSFDDTWSAFSFRLANDTNSTKKPATEERKILQYIDAAAKTVRLPDALKLALDQHKTAADFFYELAYSHRKEYVEWIVTAKRDLTRKNRVDATIAMLEKKCKNPGEKKL